MKKQQQKSKKDWYKPKGYLHFTDKLEGKDRKGINRIVKNKTYVARHAFYPLIFYNIVTRRRTKGLKKRPIAYATHLDSQIYSYYAEQLSQLYEKRLTETSQLSESATAYRAIADENGKGKRNIHFAKETFDAIADWGDCKVLMLDIKSFFDTLDHQLIKQKWAKLLDKERHTLPPDHYNVYKAVSNFAYVRKEQLKTKKGGFDEAHLAQLRTEGIQAFFRSGQEFRKLLVQNPNIKIYKNQRKLNGKNVGIPQGLPISPVLANLYMLDFDEYIVKQFVQKRKCFYRRYSDDIAIICKASDMQHIQTQIHHFIKKNTRLEIAKQKTEIFTCTIKDGRQYISNDKNNKTYLTYLGFEYYGNKTLIKSGTIAKYYRKMKQSIQRKVRRIAKLRDEGTDLNPVLFRRKLYRSYTHLGKNRRKIEVPAYEWEEYAEGNFLPKKTMKSKKHWGNFLTYAYEADKIMGSKGGIRKQVKRHMNVFQSYLSQQMDKYDL